MRQPHRHRAGALLASILALWSGLGAASQQPPPAVALRVTTRLVLVDVVVTDKEGRPVADLTRDDFTLLESGKRQAISVFAFKSPATRNAEAQPPPPLPENVYTNRPEYRRAPGPPTILLLDLLNTAQRDQVFAREKMLEYLSTQLKPNQQYAILALGSELLLLQDFTSDPRSLIAALENYRTQKSAQIARYEPNQIPPEIAAWVRPEVLKQMAELNAQQLAEATDDRVRLTLAALRGIARAVNGLPGRKNLVWVSAAFPFTLTPAGLASESGANRVYATEMRRTANVLADAQIAIYPVDARGLVGADQLEVTEEDLTTPYGRRGFQVNEDVLTRSPAMVSGAHQTMEQLAQDTGGRAFKNRSDIETAIDQVLADGSTYYTLGYYPENEDWDGKFRRLEVKLARKGLQVRHRRGFYATDPMRAWQDEPDKDALLQAALTDPLPPTAVTFLASVPPAVPAGPAEVEIAFSIDVRTVAFETLPDGSRHASLDLLAVAYSPAADPVTASRTFGIQLPPEAYRAAAERGLLFRLPLPLPPGEYEFRLLVRDNRTGLTGRLDLPYSVPQAAP